MSCATLPVEILDARPYVHIWMTTHEAAEILDVTVGVVEQKLSSGELQSRTMADGTEEVLICLPDRPAVPVHAAMAPAVDVLHDIERKLAPPPMPASYPVKRGRKATDTPSQTLQWTRSSDVRKAKRNARVAWAMTVLVIVGAGAALEVVWQRAVDSRLKVEAIMGAVHRMSATNVVLAADRMRLDTELADARQKISKAHEELAIERNIEDTLLKVAIRKHEGVADVGTAFADGGQ
jgi:hypothetical protein